MKRDKILVGQKQLQRWQMMELVKAGKITLKEAAEKIGLSYRQAKRMKRAVKEEGIEGLLHRNMGRGAWNRIEEEMRQEVVRLSKEIYRGFNDSHFTEKLKEEEGIEISRETVRKLRRGAGIGPKRKRRAKKHYKRRERKAQEGVMMLWDGSPHRWFGEQIEPCCLMAAIDDATGKILAARFFPTEGSTGYFWLLRRVVENYGIPASVYQDRHSALRRNDEKWSIEEQLAGRQTPTQVGMALEGLGIEPIFALTPQAKGRVERLFNTLQDRLVAELLLRKITTLQTANDFLEESFIESFNNRFAIAPKESQKAWRKAARSLDLDRVISFNYTATVGNDNAVRLGGLIIDIAPGAKRRSYAKARVEVRQLLDGSWRVYYKNEQIAVHPPTSLTEPLQIWKRNNKAVSVYLASAPRTAS